MSLHNPGVDPNVEQVFDEVNRPNRRLETGMSVTRFGKGEGLADFCVHLASLQSQFPELGVMSPAIHKRMPAIKELGATEVRFKSHYIGHLAFSLVRAELIREIPSLGEALEDVELLHVGTSPDRRGGEFVNLIPHEEDEGWIRNERSEIFRVVDDLVGDRVDWNRIKPCDMTVAYIPKQYAREGKSAILDVVKGLLPIEVTVSAARIA